MPSAEVEIHTVDAFTSEPFAGNPAAVCLLEDERSDRWLQAVAAEMNLSETAFLWRAGDDGWRLRWFTPARRGRRSAATRRSPPRTCSSRRAARGGARSRFATQSGALARRAGAGRRDRARLPRVPRASRRRSRSRVAAALGVTPVAARRSSALNRDGDLAPRARDASARCAPRARTSRALRAAGAPAVIADRARRRAPASTSSRATSRRAPASTRTR